MRLTMKNYELVLKFLGCAWRAADVAADITPALNDKIEYRRLRRELGEVRQRMRLMYYTFEDCINGARPTAPK